MKTSDRVRWFALVIFLELLGVLIGIASAHAQWSSPADVLMGLSQQWQQGAYQQQQLELQREQMRWNQAHPYYPSTISGLGPQSCVTHRIGSYWYTDCY